jgi:hypothetical protein
MHAKDACRSLGEGGPVLSLNELRLASQTSLAVGSLGAEAVLSDAASPAAPRAGSSPLFHTNPAAKNASASRFIVHLVGDAPKEVTKLALTAIEDALRECGTGDPNL